MTQHRPRVDTELVRRGLARSREHASTLVATGRVRAGGHVVAKPAQRVAADAELAVAVDSADPEYASRAGHKLAGALAAFDAHGAAPPVRGRRCLDVGSSTGGFTDVLLRAGAARVVCLDVGRDQLVTWLRDDPRTVVLEGRNVRDITVQDPGGQDLGVQDLGVQDLGGQDLGVQDLGGQIDLAVVDVSFISLKLVLPAVVGVAAADADLMLMVKPQFEVGRHRLGGGGVVRDPVLRREAVHGVADAAAALGWGLRGATPSPLPGPAGNVEFFLWLARGPATASRHAIDRAVDQAVAAGPHGERVSW